MRRISLFLSAAFFAAAPLLASGGNAAWAASAPMSPAPAAPVADAPSTFTDAQRTEIENILKDYLTKKNPEVLVQAMQELQKRQQADADTKTKAALTADHDKIYSNPEVPVGGNPKGDVTVVEFFDYQCGYCKMSEPNIEKLLKEDKNVKLIYEEFPILGPLSVTASKAALASARQGKYLKFHDALLNQQQHLTEDLLYKVAKDSGLDIDKLKKDMDDEKIKNMVEANVELGEEIGARGTPTFIINNQVFPGAMEYNQLKKNVDDARTAKNP